MVALHILLVLLFPFMHNYIGVMIVIETAIIIFGTIFWLECDSSLVISVSSSLKLVPWKLRNRWINCLALSKKMNPQYSPIYRERNSCTDKLANYDTSVQCFIW